MPAHNRAASPSAEALAHGYNSAGHALFCRMLRSPGNIGFSPFSIGAAMGMALAGAGGATEEEIARLFAPKSGKAARDAANAEVLAILSSYNTGEPSAPKEQECEIDGYSIKVISQPSPEIKLVAANALATVGSSTALSAGYAGVLARSYGAELLAEATADSVNAWVCERTAGKIGPVVQSLDPETVAILINALYFKAAWREQFERDLTSDGSFQLASGETVKTPMMRDPKIRLHFHSGRGYRAIRLPYTEWRLGMIVVLPERPEELAAVAERLDADEMAELRKSIAKPCSKPFDLMLPRFKTSIQMDIAGHLRQLGVRLGFDRHLADFSGATARGPFWIQGVQHCAAIDVNEDGTEAAAVTMMAAGGGRFREEEPEPFYADRPFLFYIVEEAAGAILFQGRIEDPRAS